MNTSRKLFSRNINGLVVEYWTTRFDTTEIFVVDGKQLDEFGLPLVIWQGDDDKAALRFARA